MRNRLSGQLTLELQPAAPPRTGKTASERGWGPGDFLERHQAGFTEHHHSGPGIPAHMRWEIVCPECGRGMTRLNGIDVYCAPCDLLATEDDLLHVEPDEAETFAATSSGAGASTSASTGNE